MLTVVEQFCRRWIVKQLVVSVFYLIETSIGAKIIKINNSGSPGNALSKRHDEEKQNHIVLMDNQILTTKN